MTPRPLQHLADFSARYPRFWKQYRTFLEGRGRDLPEWPEWCYCPLAAAYAIISGGGDNRCTPAQALDIGRMGALAAWRATKGIYRFDEDLLDALLDTPVAGDLPTDILHRLPEWCVYIELPAERQIGDAHLHGFFAHLEWDPGDGRSELRLLMDAGAGDDDLVPIPLHLTGGTLGQAIEAAQNEAIFQRARQGPMSSEQLAEMQTTFHAGQAPLHQTIAPLISVLLYLCTEDADMAPNEPHPGRRTPPSRTHAAQNPTTRDTGFRVGAALRRARAPRGEPGRGHHASPRPHVRRAHWHTYWRGPKGSQEPFLRWLSPMLVAARDEDELIPTIRPVKIDGEDA